MDPTVEIELRTSLRKNSDVLLGLRSVWDRLIKTPSCTMCVYVRRTSRLERIHTMELSVIYTRGWGISGIRILGIDWLYYCDMCTNRLQGPLPRNQSCGEQQ